MATVSDEALPAEKRKGFLAFVERAGNLLPEPAMIFVWLILILMLLSAVAAHFGLLRLHFPAHLSFLGFQFDALALRQATNVEFC